MRYVLPLCVLATVGTILVLNSVSIQGAPDDNSTDGPRIPSYTFAEMRQIHALTDELEETAVRRAQFTAAADAVRQEVWEGKIDLLTAADRILAQAKECNPAFATIACSHFPNLSEREAVAAVTLRVIRTETTTRGAAEGRSPERYEDLLCELSASAEFSPVLAALNAATAPRQERAGTEAPRHGRRSPRDRGAR